MTLTGLESLMLTASKGKLGERGVEPKRGGTCGVGCKSTYVVDGNDRHGCN